MNKKIMNQRLAKYMKHEMELITTNLPFGILFVKSFSKEEYQ